MSKILFWKCHRCLKIKPRSCFGEISLGCLCRECQAELTTAGTTPVNAPQQCRVRATRVFHTPRPSKNAGNDN